MKSIFLAVVVVCALAIAGIGGTLANFSDTEMALDNYFTTGDMDLKVYDCDTKQWTDDPPYGVGAKDCISIDCAWPEKEYHESIWVANFGCVDGELWIEFKDVVCSNVEPTHPLATQQYPWKNEPELVEEYGGWLDQIHICGYQNPVGDDCSLPDYVEVAVAYDGSTVIDWILMSALPIEEYVYLGQLPACGAENQKEVKVWFRFADWEDTAWHAYNGSDPMFKYHLTNALMGDRMSFNVNFGLVSKAAP